MPRSRADPSVKGCEASGEGIPCRRRGGAAVWTRLLSPKRGRAGWAHPLAAAPPIHRNVKPPLSSPYGVLVKRTGRVTWANAPDEKLLVCANCSRPVREGEAEALGWRHWSDGLDLHLICALCPHSGSANVTARRRQHFNVSAQTVAKIQRREHARPRSSIGPVTRAWRPQPRRRARVVAREQTFERCRQRRTRTLSAGIESASFW